jgi:hypothetical protein
MQATLARRPSLSITEPTNLVELACKQLERHPHFRGRSRVLSIHERDKTLFVSGQLPTFYLKQLVQETLLNLPGVQGVQNEVDVVNSDGVSSVRN